jgi:Protein of unknown function (DUF2537)
VRLTASGGQAWLDERPLDALGETAGLPDELCQALRRWAGLATRPSAAEAVSVGGEQLAALVALVRGEPVQYVDPTSGVVRLVGTQRTAAERCGGDEPTPWATGLTVFGFVTVLVAALDLALTATLRAEYRWVWIPVNVLVGIGLAPTVLLLRRAPFWRWIAHGIAAGLVIGWLALIVTAAF